jgi:hypothetical protein
LKAGAAIKAEFSGKSDKICRILALNFIIKGW